VKKKKTKNQRIAEMVELIKKHYAPKKKKENQLGLFEEAQ